MGGSSLRKDVCGDIFLSEGIVSLLGCGSQPLRACPCTVQLDVLDEAEMKLT